MRFPDKAQPPPGPLALLAAQIGSTRPAPTLAVQGMLAALPPHLATRSLQADQPRVLERLAAIWREPRAHASGTRRSA